ncbi:cell division protein FtsL [Marinicella sp. W31]|uniref:cell division protein FtsL n=1 Tax=Marinicella sp. W31 TaxID=3023713 RepID=UPI003757F710
MWIKWIIAAVLTASLLWLSINYVYSRHQTRKVFADLQALEQQQQDLNTEWGRLQLEKSTLVGNNRIESVAKEQLGMRLPASEQIIVIKR